MRHGTKLRETREHARSARRRAVLTTLVVLAFTPGAFAQDRPLGPVPVPPENPVTEAKRVLGKILFFDEQLSSDDTVACATCHVMSVAGADPRRAPAAGADGVLGTADDPLGSPGVVAQDTVGDFDPDPAFGLGVQVTGRAANPAVMAMYAEELFWDGRASSTFRDPVTGEVLIASGGALESQAVGPPTSDVEMAHADRDWAQIAAKLAERRPLALAEALPADVASALAGDPGYGDLFAAAFGDDAITAGRIGMAIATYERTLVADRTDWDRFVAGDTSALTQAEQRGLGALRQSRCLDCHAPPVFSDGSFRNIGVRPIEEDAGRFDVTGDPRDRGRFKVPTLRNAALKRSFFHDGRRTTLQQVLGFYADAPGERQFPENQDPLMAQVRVPRQAVNDVLAFLQGGLVDERVRNEAFPFDRPRLGSEITARRPRLEANGRAGAAGVPGLVAPIPAFSGNAEFRVGLERAAPGTTATLAISRLPPVNGEVRQDDVVGPLTVLTEGHATARHSLVDALGGDLYLQWRIADGSAPGGVALSPAVAVTVFAVRGETIEPWAPGGVDDPVEPQEPAVVVDDAVLHVDRVRLRIDHRRDGSDRLDVRGSINPRGAGDDPEGAVVTLVLGDVQVATAALDSRGRGGADGVDVRLDVESGAFRVSVKNADLRAATGLDAVDGSGVVGSAVELRLAGLGLDDDAYATEIALAWKSRKERTKARHSFRSDGALSGLFRSTRLRADDEVAGRHRVRLTALLDGTDDAPLDVSGGLTIVVGDAAPQVVSPVSLKTARSGKVKLVGTSGALRKVILDPRRRTLKIDADDLVTGLPSVARDGDEADLTVRVTAGAPTDTSAPTFETVVRLRRKGGGWRQ